MNEVATNGGLGDVTPLIRPTQALTRSGPRPTSLGEQPEAAVAQAPVRYGFRIGSVALLLEERTLSEVVDVGKVYPLPNTPSWLSGITNLRGNLVPVIDLGDILAFDQASDNGNEADAASSAASSKTYLLVVDKGERAIAFVTEQLPVAVRDAGHPVSAPVIPAALRKHVSSAWLCGESVWFEFDHRSFLEALSAKLRTA